MITLLQSQYPTARLESNVLFLPKKITDKYSCISQSSDIQIWKGDPLWKS